VYSVRHADKRIATFALQRCALSAELSLIRGPCNAQVSKEIVAAVMRWLRAQPLLPLYYLAAMPFALGLASIGLGLSGYWMGAA
jgi:hypothetical protein